MASYDRLTTYLDLLKVRQTGRKRTATITGVLFFAALLITLAAGLLGRGGAQMVLIAVVDASLGLSYMMTWVRLEITNENIELLKSLQS
jgi:hypothetical protein